MSFPSLLPRLMLGGLLLGAALPGRAQTTASDSAAAPRFYVGLGAYSSFYQPLGGQYDRGVRLPVQLTLGYQWRPRLAVQAAVAYSGVAGSYFGIGRYYDVATPAAAPGNFFEYNGHTTERATSLAVLARYTLTRQSAHRLQLDVLGGFALEHGSFRDYGSYTDSTALYGLRTDLYDKRSTANRLLLSLGAGARYRLGPRFELFYDLTFNTNLLANAGYTVSGLTSASALGLRYRFGRH